MNEAEYREHLVEFFKDAENKVARIDSILNADVTSLGVCYSRVGWERAMSGKTLVLKWFEPLDVSMDAVPGIRTELNRQRAAAVATMEKMEAAMRYPERISLYDNQPFDMDKWLRHKQATVQTYTK